MSPIVLGLGSASTPAPTTLSYTAADYNDAASIVRSASYRGSLGGEDPIYWHSRSGSSLNTNLRFVVQIPRNATIVDARLVVYAGETRSGADEGDYITVGAEQVDNASQITTYSAHNTRASNVGTTVQWPVPNISSGQADISPNLASVVQQIVNRPGWPDGTSAGIQFFCESSSPSAGGLEYTRRSLATAPSSATYPQFEVTYTV